MCLSAHKHARRQRTEFGMRVRFDERAELHSAARHRLSMTRAEEVLMLPLRAETTAL
jgi:hypothetical protein